NAGSSTGIRAGAALVAAGRACRPLVPASTMPDHEQAGCRARAARLPVARAEGAPVRPDGGRWPVPGETGRYAEALRVAAEAALVAGARLRAEFHRPGGPRGAGE